jgi:hypothetical protein
MTSAGWRAARSDDHPRTLVQRRKRESDERHPGRDFVFADGGLVEEMPCGRQHVAWIAGDRDAFRAGEKLLQPRKRKYVLRRLFANGTADFPGTLPAQRE